MCAAENVVTLPDNYDIFPVNKADFPDNHQLLRDFLLSRAAEKREVYFWVRQSQSSANGLTVSFVFPELIKYSLKGSHEKKEYQQAHYRIKRENGRYSLDEAKHDSNDSQKFENLPQFVKEVITESIKEILPRGFPLTYVSRKSVLAMKEEASKQTLDVRENTLG